MTNGIDEEMDYRAPFVLDSGEMARDIYEMFADGVCCAY
jgi:hypothetical protein